MPRKAGSDTFGVRPYGAMGRLPGRAEIFIDGACLGNPGPAGIGVVIKDGGQELIRELSKSIGETTNNVAEYLALVYALQEALQLGYEKVSVKSDSELLVNQLGGSYKVRQPHLRLFYDLAVHLRQGFKDCSIEHIPRSKNVRADALAGKGAVDARSQTPKGARHRQL